MVLLVASLSVLPLIGPGWSVMAFGLLLGAAGGSIRSVEAAAYAHHFGTSDLGGIRGIATTISVGSTAFGPLALAAGRDAFGGFVQVTLLLVALPVIVAIATPFVPAPSQKSSRLGGAVQRDPR